MLKKLMPILLILLIFVGFQIYPTKINKEKINNFENLSTDNELNIESNTSKNANRPIVENSSLHDNKNISSEPHIENNDMIAINEENISDLSEYSDQNITKDILVSKPEEHNPNTSTPETIETIETKEVNINNINTTIQKNNISISHYLNNLQCINYQLKAGETLTDIARKYESKCNLNTTIKFITSINKINDKNNLDSGIYLSIPEETLKNGIMYTVISGDTWHKISDLYYSQYDTDSIMNFLVYINDLPNNDLPLGEAIFLSSI